MQLLRIYLLLLTVNPFWLGCGCDEDWDGDEDRDIHPVLSKQKPTNNKVR